MEVDKRKKRVTRGDVKANEGERDRLKKLRVEDGGASGCGGGASGDPVAVPTEEEVEEFFAILRRMKVAVKYFDDKGRGGKEWREVLEQADVRVEDGENVDDHHRETGGAAVNKNKGEEVIINEGFDLNTVAPEAADGGDDE
ncbi:uncharacterized protein LOC133290870 [Gastrolobium bilobum]|uniref:uncharacterized protein LOC133290870 n=1 Tax=Gastrolobium bilobum TaxID=150636 RepID=UPI002AB0AE02|nr:uncharacterized protein LOC133290870 [Gastrolobium bilobum]